MTETKVKTAEQGKPKQSKPDLATQVRNILYVQFEDIPGSIKCRILWEHEGVTRVRANWLQSKDGFEVVTHSKFLHVQKSGSGLSVVECEAPDK